MTPADRLPGIHALRVVAAAAVFLLHALNATGAFGPRVTEPTDILHFGVPLFFAVSAFSLMYSTQPYAGTRGWVSRFYTKRYFRIAPLFYFMIVVDVALLSSMSLSNVFRQAPLPGWFDILLNVTFLFGLSPDHVSSLVLIGWSVGTEMLFYLVFPLVLIGIRGIWSAFALFVASCIVGEIARPLLDPLTEPFIFSTLSDFHVLTNFRYFAAGVLAFHVFRKLRSTALGRADAGWLPAAAFHLVCAAIAAGLVASLVLYEDRLEGFYHLDMAAWSALFVVLTVWWGLRPMAILGWAPIQFLGERSYSLYLVHFPTVLLCAPLVVTVYGWIQPLMGGWAVPVVVAGVYLPVVALSSLTYWLIERPGMDLGKRVGAGLRRRAASVVEQPAATPPP